MSDRWTTETDSLPPHRGRPAPERRWLGWLRYIAMLALATIVIGNLAVAAYHVVARRSGKAPLQTSQTLVDQEASVPATRYEFFAGRVVPILDRRCGNCHGVSQETFDQITSTRFGGTLLRWVADPSGRILGDEEHCRLAYRRCRWPADQSKESLRPIDYASPPLASPMLRVPLAAAYSGVTHPEVFATPEDRDFATLQQWVEMEITAVGQAPRTLQTKAERFFAEQVVPILNRKTCFGTNCHGPQAFMDLKMDPGIPALPGRFTPDIHQVNRQAMLGANSRLVHLSGDIEQSKQLLKNIPVEQGGIVHKGGNNFFEKGDPDYEVLVRWLQLEKAEACQRTGAALGQMRGIVFVRRPRAAPERFFEDDRFLAGGDLFWLRDGQEINLTARLHPDGPADIRAPDVSYDATRVVFAMRRAAAEPLNVWEIVLETGSARQLTFSTDPNVHFLDPLYVPDPDDESGEHLDRVCVVFVSNREGRWCTSSPEGILGEAEEGSDNTILDEQRTEQGGTFDGRTLRVVRGTNVGQERRIVHYEPGRIVVDHPFELPCDSTTHYVIDVPARMAPKYDAYRMRLASPGQEAQTFATTLKQLTFSASQVRRPSMRSTGEIVFSALRTGWQDGRPLFNSALFRTHVDGSNFHIHNGSRSSVPIFSDDREMPNGLEIRIGRNADSWWGGLLMLSDHQFGPSIEPDNPADNLDHPYRLGMPDHSEHRFVPGWISLDPAVNCRGLSPGGAYRDPYPLPDGAILAAHAPGPLDLHDADAAPDFDIVRLVPDPAFQSSDGFAPGRFRRQTVIAGPHSELWPRPVVVRLKEPVRKKLKKQEDLFGPAATARGFTGYPPGTPAVLKMFDLLLIDVFFQQIAPSGQRPIASPVSPISGQENAEIDQVTHARIIGAHPQYEGDTGPPRRFIIVEVPVEQDGSFYVQLPSGVSWDIQSLNSQRMAIRSPRRWLYCQPGEQHTLSIPRPLYAQVCSGCHGGLTGRPVDTLRRPDVVTAASRTDAVWDPDLHRARRPANYSDSDQVSTIEVDFQHDVRPILNARCTSCHSGEEPAAGLDVNGKDSFDALRVLVEHREALAIKSYLIEKLIGKELHAARTLQGDTPHPSDAPLSAEEVLTLIRWIDLGAARDKGGSK